MKEKTLIAAYFSLGAFALVSQTMIVREFFVVVYGNEFIFGVLLANWLIGIFTGAMLGGSAADKYRDNLKLFVISILVMAIVFPLAVAAIRFLYIYSGTDPGTYISFSNVFLYSATLIIPVSFFIGFAFPVAARVHSANASSQNEKVKKISHIYIIEAFGSLFGGIVYTFFLVGRFNPFFIAALIILPLMFSGWAILHHTHHKYLRTCAVFLLIVNVILLTPTVSQKIESITVKKRWQSFSQLPLSFSADSRYQNISVSSIAGRSNLYLNTTFAAVFPNDEDNRLLAAHLWCQHPKPQRILVIGDAVSGLAKFLLQYNPEKIVSVEIDPQVVDTIFKFLPPEERRALQKDHRFEIRIMDGRKFVKDILREPGQTSRYDLVYVNVPEPSTLLLNRYYTREFFSDLYQLVGPDGVIALDVTASENYTQGMVSAYTASIYNTLKSVFPHIAVAPGTHHFLFASGNPASITDEPAILEQRYRNTGVSPQRLGMIFYSLYPHERTREARQALENQSHSRLNTDETPIAGFFFNKIIGWYGQSRASNILEFFEKTKPIQVIALVLILLAARLGFLFFRLRSGNRETIAARSLKVHTLAAVFSGGMAGLALELVLLYMFQNHFGSVYYIIGFIIALFMFGLPLGAHASTRLLRRGKTHIIHATIVVQFIIAAAALALPHTVKIFTPYGLLNQLIIFAETVIIGITIGLLFPLAIHLYLGESGKTGKTAGWVDAIDHIGAAAGALFIGSLFLPVMGVDTVCYLLSLFPLASAALLVTNLLNSRKAEKK